MLLIGGLALVLCVGGVVAVAASGSGKSSSGTRAAAQQLTDGTTSPDGTSAGPGSAGSTSDGGATSGAAAAPGTSPAPGTSSSQQPDSDVATGEPAPPATVDGTPSVTEKQIVLREAIPFKTRTEKDASLAAGKTVVRTAGADGVRTLTYRVVYTNGKETGRTLVITTVVTQPTTKVVAVGTKATTASSKCDPNYTPCVPIASDVDCAGGGGNGPAFVTGPVKVIGTDIYNLDADGDGIGCN